MALPLAGSMAAQSRGHATLAGDFLNRIYAHGTIPGDRLIGTFGYVTQILVEDSPLGSGDADEFEFYGVRIR